MMYNVSANLASAETSQNHILVIMEQHWDRLHSAATPYIQWRSQDVYDARAQVIADGAIVRRKAPGDFFARLSTCSLSVLLSSSASSLSWVSSGHVCFR